MKPRLCTVLIALMCFCATAAAQIDNCCFAGWQCNSDQEWINGYHAYQTGQCAAPAQSQTGASSPIDNCCQAGWQCNSDQEWVNGYHAYLNGECAAPAQSQPGTPAQTGLIDNCCQAGWQCYTGQDWVNGYHAYQNGQCATPAQSQAATSTPAGMIDNCCQGGWQCQTAQEWSNGFYAYRDNQCGTAPQVYSAYSCCDLGWNCTFEFDYIMARWVYTDNDRWCNMPRQEIVDGVIIEGSDEFIAQHKAAMRLLHSRAPEWYAYVVNIIKKIRESPGKTGYGTLHKSFNLPVWHSVEYAAAIIVHETCHVHRSFAGVHTHEYENIAEEPICDQLAIEALQQFSPGTYYSRKRIDEYFGSGHTWDYTPSVRREWQRARDIYARTT